MSMKLLALASAKDMPGFTMDVGTVCAIIVFPIAWETKAQNSSKRSRAASCRVDHSLNCSVTFCWCSCNAASISLRTSLTTTSHCAEVPSMSTSGSLLLCRQTLPRVAMRRPRCQARLSLDGFVNGRRKGCNERQRNQKTSKACMRERGEERQGRGEGDMGISKVSRNIPNPSNQYEIRHNCRPWSTVGRSRL